MDLPCIKVAGLIIFKYDQNFTLREDISLGINIHNIAIIDIKRHIGLQLALDPRSYVCCV